MTLGVIAKPSIENLVSVHVMNLSEAHSMNDLLLPLPEGVRAKLKR